MNNERESTLSGSKSRDTHGSAPSQDDVRNGLQQQRKDEPEGELQDPNQEAGTVG